MSRYLQAAVMAMLVLGAAAFAQAQTPKPGAPTMSAAGDLTPEQEDAIYAAATEGVPEREPPTLRIGDELPWWAQVRTLPDALQIESAIGLLYAVIPTRTAAGIRNDVFRVDPATNKIVRIIRKPLTFKF